LTAMRYQVAWVPGNHDDLEVAEEVLMRFDKITFEKKFIINEWCLLLLNTHYEGYKSGKLPRSELKFLKNALDEYNNKFIGIYLHHHVLPSRCDWLDEMRIVNYDDFLAIVANHSRIKFVSCGHIHQDTSTHWQDIEFLSTPATSVQFEEASADFALGTKMPGYRWFNLVPQGAYSTGVVRVAENEKFIPDLTITGYE